MGFPKREAFGNEDVVKNLLTGIKTTNSYWGKCAREKQPTPTMVRPALPGAAPVSNSVTQRTRLNLRVSLRVVIADPSAWVSVCSLVDRVLPRTGFLLCVLREVTPTGWRTSARTGEGVERGVPRRWQPEGPVREKTRGKPTLAG